MQERRINERHIEQGRVAIRILSVSYGPALEGQTFFCLTRDVSADGLSFEMHMPIPRGAKLELSIEFSNPVERFRRLGRVVRCRDSQRDVVVAYRIGIKLLQNSGSEYTAWREAVDRRRSLLGGDSLVQQNDSRPKTARDEPTLGEKHEDKDSPTGA